jgi:hypothetical protein
MASLLIGHASACACSHHDEPQTAEAGCHSHHETTEAVEVVSDADVCDTGCVCFVDQPSPFANSKAPTREFKASDEIAKAAEFLPDLDLVAITAHTESSPGFVKNLSYSSTLKSLLPSRAPPRL